MFKPIETEDLKLVWISLFLFLLYILNVMFEFCQSPASVMIIFYGCCILMSILNIGLFIKNFRESAARTKFFSIIPLIIPFITILFVVLCAILYNLTKNKYTGIFYSLSNFLMYLWPVFLINSLIDNFEIVKNNCDKEREQKFKALKIIMLSIFWILFYTFVPVYKGSFSESGGDVAYSWSISGEKTRTMFCSHEIGYSSTDGCWGGGRDNFDSFCILGYDYKNGIREGSLRRQIKE